MEIVFPSVTVQRWVCCFLYKSIYRFPTEMATFFQFIYLLIVHVSPMYEYVTNIRLYGV